MFRTDSTADRTWLRLDVIAAFLGIVVSFASLPLYLFVSHLYVIGIPLMIGIASTVYLLSVFFPRSRDLSPVSGDMARLFPSLCILGMAILVVLASIQGVRSLIFYHIAIIVGALLFYQILFSRDGDFSVPVVLGQVLIFAFILRFAALYTSPEYVGIDIWTHVPNWTAAIIESESLAPLDGNKYYAAPWFHLLVAVTAMFGGASLEHSLTFSAGIVLPLTTLLVYMTARLFTTPRWSTLAAAMVAVLGYMLEWSIHLIPTSLGLAFFGGIFFLLCRLLLYRFDTAEFILLILFNLGVVLTHQVATFITLVLLAASVLAVLVASPTWFEHRHALSPEENRLTATNLTGLFVFDLGFVTFMWSLTPMHGRSFLETTWLFFQDTLTESDGFGDIYSERAPEDAPLLEQTVIGQLVSVIDGTMFFILFALAVLGGLVALHQRYRSYPILMMGAAIAGMSFFVFVFPMFGVRSFIPRRWYAFMAIPMVILAAIGVAHVRREVPTPVALAILLVLALCFPAVGLISTPGSIDHPVFEEEQIRYSYSPSELAAVEAVSQRVTAPEDPTENTTLRTDHPYQTVFDRTESHPAGMLELSESGLGTPDIVVYRSYQSSGAAHFGDGYGRSFSPGVAYDAICTPDRSATYDNGEVTMCLG